MGLSEVTILITGIALILIGLTRLEKKCPPPKIEYTFVPRTFEEEQNNPVQPSEIFSDMFTSTPFVAGFSISLTPSEINKNYISQV